MTYLRMAMLLLIPLLLSGCLVRTLHPLCTPADQVFEPGLLGLWVDVDDENISYEFSRLEGDIYSLVQRDANEDETSYTVARLMQIGETWLLDVYPDYEQSDCPNFFLWHNVPAHMFYRIDRFEPTLMATTMHYGWLAEYLEGNPGALAHELQEVPGDEEAILVITASTEELKAFIDEQLANEEAWYDLQEYARQ